MSNAMSTWSEQVLNWSDRYRVTGENESGCSIMDRASDLQRAYSAATLKMAPTSFPCPICGQRTSQPKELQRHLDTVCGVARWFRCPYQNCRKRPLSRKDRFQTHVREVHPRNDGNYPNPDACSFTTVSRIAFGCGFCDAGPFEKTNDFVKHIAAHYKRGLKLKHDWDSSQELRNLLRHSQAKDIWYQLAAPRHGENSRAWPDLQWDSELTKHFINMLQYAQPAERLRSQLQHLLELASIPQPATSSSFNNANVCYAPQYPMPQVDPDLSMNYPGYGSNEAHLPAQLQPFNNNGVPDILNVPLATDEYPFDLVPEDVEQQMYDEASNFNYW